MGEFDEMIRTLMTGDAYGGTMGRGRRNNMKKLSIASDRLTNFEFYLFFWRYFNVMKYIVLTVYYGKKNIIFAFPSKSVLSYTKFLILLCLPIFLTSYYLLNVPAYGLLHVLNFSLFLSHS